MATNIQSAPLRASSNDMYHFIDKQSWNVIKNKISELGLGTPTNTIYVRIDNWFRASPSHYLVDMDLTKIEDDPYQSINYSTYTSGNTVQNYSYPMYDWGGTFGEWGSSGTPYSGAHVQQEDEDDGTNGSDWMLFVVKCTGGYFSTYFKKVTSQMCKGPTGSMASCKGWNFEDLTNFEFKYIKTATGVSTTSQNCKFSMFSHKSAVGKGYTLSFFKGGTKIYSVNFKIPTHRSMKNWEDFDITDPSSNMPSKNSFDAVMIKAQDSADDTRYTVLSTNVSIMPESRNIDDFVFSKMRTGAPTSVVYTDTCGKLKKSTESLSVADDNYHAILFGHDNDSMTDFVGEPRTTHYALNLTQGRSNYVTMYDGISYSFSLSKTSGPTGSNIVRFAFGGGLIVPIDSGYIPSVIMAGPYAPYTFPYDKVGYALKDNGGTWGNVEISVNSARKPTEVYSNFNTDHSIANNFRNFWRCSNGTQACIYDDKLLDKPYDHTYLIVCGKTSHVDLDSNIKFDNANIDKAYVIQQIPLFNADKMHSLITTPNPNLSEHFSPGKRTFVRCEPIGDNDVVVVTPADYVGRLETESLEAVNVLGSDTKTINYCKFGGFGTYISFKSHSVIDNNTDDGYKITHDAPGSLGQAWGQVPAKNEVFSAYYDGDDLKHTSILTPPANGKITIKKNVLDNPLQEFNGQLSFNMVSSPFKLYEQSAFKVEVFAPRSKEDETMNVLVGQVEVNSGSSLMIPQGGAKLFQRRTSKDIPLLIKITQPKYHQIKKIQESTHSTTGTSLEINPQPNAGEVSVIFTRDESNPLIGIPVNIVVKFEKNMEFPSEQKLAIYGVNQNGNKGSGGYESLNVGDNEYTDATATYNLDTGEVTLDFDIKDKGTVLDSLIIDFEEPILNKIEEAITGSLKKEFKNIKLF